MHKSARDHMALCITTYLRDDRHYDVLDFGSYCSDAQRGMTHRKQLEGYKVTCTGVDVRPGPNVDVVMKKPYRLPFRSKSFDLVVTGQTFEHIPFIWASFLEICRVLRPSGLIFLTAPSRGHPHFFLDPWRYYPDSMRSLAAISRMKLREAHTDLPPLKPRTDRLDYKSIDEERAYWGDTVGVFQKPKRYSKLVAVAREVNVWWANRVNGIDHVPIPKALPARSKVSATDLARTPT